MNDKKTRDGRYNFYDDDLPLYPPNIGGVQSVEIIKDTTTNNYELIVNSAKTSSFVDNYTKNVYYDEDEQSMVFQQLVDGNAETLNVSLSSITQSSPSYSHKIIMKLLKPSHALIQRLYVNIGSTVYTTKKGQSVICLKPNTTFTDAITNNNFSTFYTKCQSLVEIKSDINVEKVESKTQLIISFKLPNWKSTDEEAIYLKIGTLSLHTVGGTNLIRVKLSDLEKDGDTYNVTIPSEAASTTYFSLHGKTKVYFPMELVSNNIVRNTDGTKNGFQIHMVQHQRMVPVKRHQVAFSEDLNSNLIAERQENVIPDFFAADSTISGVSKSTHGVPLIDIDTLARFIRENDYEVWWYVSTHNNGGGPQNNHRYNWKRCYNTNISGTFDKAVLSYNAQRMGLVNDGKIFKYKVEDGCNQIGGIDKIKKRYIDFAIFKIKSRNHTKTVCYENGAIFRYYAKGNGDDGFTAEKYLKRIGTIKYPKQQK